MSERNQDPRHCRRSTPRKAASVLLASLLAAAPAAAQWPGDVDAEIPVRSENSASRWWSAVRDNDELLRAGNWSKAQRKAQRLVKRVVEKSYYDPELTLVLADLAFQQAVAEVAQGLDRRGIWRWHMALNLNPDLSRRDLGAYGEAGQVLSRHPLRGLGKLPEDTEALTAPMPVLGFDPPRLPDDVVLDEMWVERALEVRDLRRLNQVEVLVDSFGYPHQPVVRDRTIAHPSLTYGILETLLAIAPLSPATLDGRRVAVLVQLDLDIFYRHKYKTGRW